jgi:GTP-sensing pleiotropic transcriptional regulator CodY
LRLDSALNDLCERAPGAKREIVSILQNHMEDLNAEIDRDKMTQKEEDAYAYEVLLQVRRIQKFLGVEL